MPQELPSQSYLICAIGDSRTYGAGASVGSDPLTLLSALLQSKYPSTAFIVNNQGVNGTTSELWLRSALLTNALAAFALHAASRPAGTKSYVQIMLGINDASGFGFGRCPQQQFLTQLLEMIDRIRAAALPGFSGIVLHSSYYAVPYGFAPEIDEQCLDEVQQLNTSLQTLVNDTDVFLGDRQAYTYFEQHPELLFDKLHASNEGNQQLAMLWTIAYQRIFSSSFAGKAL